MKLIVGLGNPGLKYEGTRHNAGFIALDYYAEKKDFQIKKLFKKALIGEQIINGEKIIFVKPQTYMNLSGDSVLSLADYYGIDNEDIFVIYDDISLPLGKIRIRAKGSAGGHNGIKDMILKLGGDDFPRLKIGVSANGDKALVDYVLGNFSKEEAKILNKVIGKTAEVIDGFIKNGVEYCMNSYNSYEAPEDE